MVTLLPVRHAKANEDFSESVGCDTCERAATFQRASGAVLDSLSVPPNTCVLCDDTQYCNAVPT